MIEKLKENLPDIQKTSPEHLLAIDRVGVAGVDFPLTLRKKDGGGVVVDAKFNMLGSLVKELKGSNLSRFVETLMEYSDKALSGENFQELVQKMQYNLKSEDMYVSAEFKYYMEKYAPISKLKMLLAYNCKFVGIIFKSGYKFYEEVTVPVTSLCACSKEMSLVDKERGLGKGAHNQRGLITLQVKCSPNSIWLEDLIKLCESCGSCEIYPLLKRPDEKFVTEEAYDHPKFVEDISREVASKTMHLECVSWFKVKVSNEESIHAHQAVAYLERVKKGKIWRNSYKGYI